MRVLSAVLGLVVIAMPVAGLAQEYLTGDSHSHSVVRPAGHWQNYMHVPDGHCGCPMPVRCGDYTDCCRPCGLRPFCFFKRVGRMLDCLLPCNKCCGGGCLIGDCHGCGWFKSHCPKRCGYCDHVGCGSACPSCGIGGMPASTDPFLDDPLQPMPEAAAPSAPTPAPDGESRLRRAPAGSRPYSLSRSSAPHHSAGLTTPRKQSSTPAPLVEPREAQKPARPAKVAATPASPSQGTRWIGQSVLRRTSYEAEPTAEPAMLPGISLDAEALPASSMDLLPPLPPVPQARATHETTRDDIPSNPLR